MKKNLILLLALITMNSVVGLESYYSPQETEKVTKALYSKFSDKELMLQVFGDAESLTTRSEVIAILNLTRDLILSDMFEFYEEERCVYGGVEYPTTHLTYINDEVFGTTIRICVSTKQETFGETDFETSLAEMIVKRYVASNTFLYFYIKELQVDKEHRKSIEKDVLYLLKKGNRLDHFSK